MLQSHRMHTCRPAACKAPPCRPSMWAVPARLARPAVAPSASSPASGGAKDSAGAGTAMPAALVAIWLTVFVQSLGEGISISSLPLHLTSLGATPVLVGAATSCFSVAQLVFCPLVVKRSGRIGRLQMLRLCLAGAAVSNMLTAAANGPLGVIAARFFAGVFAASVPVAQSAVTDVVEAKFTTVALSRVSSAAQMGIVVGPIASATLAGVFSRCGVPSHLTVRCVFAASALLAVSVLVLSHIAQGGRRDPARAAQEATGSATTTRQAAESGQAEPSFRLAQPFLRLCALSAGWSLTLSVAIYCLFGARFLGYSQPQLSSIFSAGAAATVLTQLFLLPWLVRQFGAHRSCTMGLLGISCGLGGLSLVRAQPTHLALYMLNRVGSGVTDTSVATLVADTSADDRDRAQNFALIQSTRAATRIVTPVLSGRLFELSWGGGYGPPGALPYLTASALAMLFAPLPLVLKGMARKSAAPAVPAA